MNVADRVPYLLVRDSDDIQGMRLSDAVLPRRPIEAQLFRAHVMSDTTSVVGVSGL